MKVLQIVDVPHWAIGHLAELVVRKLPHITFKTLYIHPREVTADAIKQMEEELDWADIVDLQYWNTARQLLEESEKLRSKKLILTHHNQKDLLGFDWKDIDYHVVHTTYAAGVLMEAGYENVEIIQYGFDLNYFKYREEEPEEKCFGYAGRIVPWKGLKEISRAAFELGYPVKIMGKLDRASYLQEIPEEHRANWMTEFMECEDGERRDFYNAITCYVGNSGPNHEEGTMPLQEAMACGTPVVTTPSGVAADLLVDHDNALVVPFGDYEALKAAMKEMIESKDLRESLRKAAWQTAKILTEKRMAIDWERLYHKVLFPEKTHPLVSVIVPTFNSKDNVIRILDSLKESAYDHLEVVVSDDGSTDGTSKAVVAWREANPEVIVKYITKKKHSAYGLATARNKAAIKAQGEFLMFLDSRLLPEPDAIPSFLEAMRAHDKEAKVWLFGNKGTNKMNFVENFSFIRRAYYLRAGGCNERINRYGGMSQELRARFGWQGFGFEYIQTAKATQMSGSHLNEKRRADIIAMKGLLWEMGMR